MKVASGSAPRVSIPGVSYVRYVRRSLCINFEGTLISIIYCITRSSPEKRQPSGVRKIIMLPVLY